MLKETVEQLIRERLSGTGIYPDFEEDEDGRLIIITNLIYNAETGYYYSSED